MTAASRRVFHLAAIVLASAGPLAFGEILDFRTAFASTASPLDRGTANFSSVAAVPGVEDKNSARAFAGGSFTRQFNLGDLNTIFSQTAEDGVLVGLTHDTPNALWVADWMLQVRCDNGNARINDVAISPLGDIYVGGTFEGDATFDLPPPLPQILLRDLQGDGAPISFIAIASPTGEWLNAFVVPGMELRSLALDSGGEIFVTGPPILARRIDPAGLEIWSIPEPPRTISLRQIAVELNATAPFIYILGTYNRDPNPAATDEDAFLIQLERSAGAVKWRTDISSSGDEHAGGLGIDPLGGLRVSVSSDGLDLRVGGTLLQDLPTVSSRHSHLLFIAPDSTLLRDRLLGTSLAPSGEMETHDLAIDYAGNAHVAVSFLGPFGFEGIPYPGQDDTAVVAVDALATPIRFTNTSGAGAAFGNAVAAPDRNLQVLAGGLQGSDPEFFDNILPFVTLPDQRAFFSGLEPILDQKAYILTSIAPNVPIGTMAQRITAVSGEVYRSLDSPNGRIRLVAAYLTTEQRSGLGQQFTSVPDVDLQQDGLVNDSGWALAALNSAPPTEPFSYTYPETCHQTALYLIDTAIDTSSGYFNANTNLNIGASILVRGIGDPLVSSKFDHGTEMLSMIAGPTYGAARGTPIEVISYDIYPDGATAKLSSLIEAIRLSNSDKALNYPYDPAVYCIASSATTPSVSPASLEAEVDYAIGPNVYATVLVSAGNTPDEDASQYTPSDLGLKSGVICVGAIDIDNTQLASTRGPEGVDLWAPGDTVAAADVAGGPTTASGTSPATALAAATALIYLSGNPVLTPADLETAVVTTHSQSDIIDPITYIPSTGVPGVMDFADWTSWYDLIDTATTGNDDGDNWTNEEEYIWGFNPRVVDYEGSLLALSYDAESSTLTIEFPLSCALYQPSALTGDHLLRGGKELSVQQSSDLQTWNDITNMITLVEEGHNSNQATISFAYEV
ncbi:MAG: S8 family serine peptidase, partial [Akkermansiaceae bacterium]